MQKTNYYMGYTVAAGDTVAAVQNYYDSHSAIAEGQPIANAGSVTISYLDQYDDGTWKEQKVVSPDPTIGAYCGEGLAARPDIVLMGCRSERQNSINSGGVYGAVHIFKRANKTGNWTVWKSFWGGGNSFGRRIVTPPMDGIFFIGASTGRLWGSDLHQAYTFMYRETNGFNGTGRIPITNKNPGLTYTPWQWWSAGVNGDVVSSSQYNAVNAGLGFLQHVGSLSVLTPRCRPGTCKNYKEQTCVPVGQCDLGITKIRPQLWPKAGGIVVDVFGDTIGGHDIYVKYGATGTTTDISCKTNRSHPTPRCRSTHSISPFHRCHCQQEQIALHTARSLQRRKHNSRGQGTQFCVPSHTLPLCRDHRHVNLSVFVQYSVVVKQHSIQQCQQTCFPCAGKCSCP
eukprot:TRINITY_DN764_c0_g1_i4.p1 TRINITY_DN764_c0_g1~~TRINITY_DN764_c0_g1_i4.p1  ORF type:complete len:399 (+),score=55.64 TRINITY_DN764_c0_g1_i4:166-1362(+)